MMRAVGWSVPKVVFVGVRVSKKGFQNHLTLASSMTKSAESEVARGSIATFHDSDNRG